jgi:hypothetical protein
MAGIVSKRMIAESPENEAMCVEQELQDTAQAQPPVQ